ncbi:hypothetical protein JCM17960_25070 [Magnetospira thiophila]
MPQLLFTLRVQRENGKPLKNPRECHGVYFETHNQSTFAWSSPETPAARPLHNSTISLHPNGVSVIGFEREGDTYVYQEWWMLPEALAQTEAPAAPIPQATRFVWDEGLSLGVEAVDDGHRVLVDQASRLEALAAEGDREGFQTLLGEMIEDCIYNFAREEGLLDYGNYPASEDQQRQHEDFLNLLRRHHGADEDPEDLLDALAAWIDGHIRDEDPDWVPYLSPGVEAILPIRTVESDSNSMSDWDSGANLTEGAPDEPDEVADNDDFFDEDLLEDTDERRPVVEDDDDETEEDLLDESDLDLDSDLFLVDDDAPSLEQPEPLEAEDEAADEALDDALIHWKDSMSVGLESIDNDHKVMISLINELHEAQDSENGEERENTVGSVLNALVEYTEYHFEREQRVMETVGYEGIGPHLKNHDDLKDVVLSLKEQFDIQPETVDLNLMYNFLRTWLVQHILKEDMAYAPLVRGNDLAAMAAESLFFSDDELEDDSENLFERLSDSGAVAASERARADAATLVREAEDDSPAQEILEPEFEDSLDDVLDLDASMRLDTEDAVLLEDDEDISPIDDNELEDILNLSDEEDSDLDSIVRGFEEVESATGDPEDLDHVVEISAGDDLPIEEELRREDDIGEPLEPIEMDGLAELADMESLMVSIQDLVRRTDAADDAEKS